MSENEPKEVLNMLEKIDLDKLTLGEIRRVNSPALRTMLSELISVHIGAKTEHVSHGKHTDHLKAQIFERPIVDNPIIDSPIIDNPIVIQDQDQ